MIRATEVEEPWPDPAQQTISRRFARVWRNCVRSAIGHCAGKHLGRQSRTLRRRGRVAAITGGSPVCPFFGSFSAEASIAPRPSTRGLSASEPDKVE